MNTVEKVISLFGGIAGVASWFLPNIGIEVKAIICLLIVLACFICLYIVQVFENKKSQELLNDIRKRHKAISRQFEDKQKLNEFYKSAIDGLYVLANQVMVSTKNERFLIFFNQFTITKNDLIERGSRDE